MPAELPDPEPVVVVHHAGTSTEAMVIRGLLESAGLKLPEPSGGDPFPMREPPAGMAGVDIVVLESQAEEAMRIISGYLSSSENIILDSSDEGPQEPAGG